MNSANRRIRSAAVNALGKMKFKDSDSEFTKKVSDKLIELASANDPKKTYNKDIAFAFRSFKNEKNIPALINLMAYNYYGVRFIAAEDLTEYGDIYYNYITNNTLSSISANKIWFQAFLNSLTNLSEDKFKSIYEKINKLSISTDEVIKYNIIELLKMKKEKSNDESFIQWSKRVINNLEKNGKMKIRD